MSTDDELLDLLGDNLEPTPIEPPADRVAALRTAAEHRRWAVPAHRARTATRTGGHGRLRRPAPGWRARTVAAAAVLVAGLAVAGGLLVTRRDAGRPAGTLEFAGALTAPDGSVGGHASVRQVGTGRVVTIDSDRLSVLPAGELYEVWFVGPGDAPGTPNRISAGTFHPDSAGRSEVQLTAAVDPARYPQMVITAEPGGGDPAPNGPEVLRADVADGP